MSLFSNPLTGKALLNKKNKIVSADDALNKARIIVLLFSGSWCPHCAELVPILKDIHEEGIRREMGLEVVNVPCDTNAKEMLEHFRSQGHWYSILFGDIIAQELRWMFTITHLPSVVVISKNGTIISKNGYHEILTQKLNVLVTWDVV